MSAPRPRIERPDDMGDVLAEIRRLVAHGSSPTPHQGDRPMVVTARVVAGDERQPNTPQSLALSVELPMTGAALAGNGAIASAPVGPMGEASVSLPVAGVGQAPAPRNGAVQQAVPFRLNPEAMIPAADPAGPLRLPRSLCVVEEAPGGAEAAHPSPAAGQVHDTESLEGAEHRGKPPMLSERPLPRPEETRAEPTEGPPAAVAAVAPFPSAMIRQADTDPRASGPTDPTPFIREPDMQAHANTPASPMQAEPAMQLVSERPAPEALHGDEENPLRALLREVVREEFEGELKRNLDDNLRRMVRAEIAAALTEALVRKSRG